MSTTNDDGIYDDTIEGSNKSDLIGADGVWTWSNSQQRYVELIPGQMGTDPGGGDVDDLVLGGSGNDAIFGGKGSDRIEGQNGNDVLWGDRQATEITSAGVTSTTDYLGSEAGKDVLIGGNGEDELHGGEGDDVLWGGAAGDESANTAENGRDALYGGSGNDLLHGGNGRDVLDGGADNDQLFGDNGGDVLLGGSGDDSLVGGHGADTLDGGAGNDRYVYNSMSDSPAGTEHDVIESFVSGATAALGDKLDLTGIESVAGSFVWRGESGAEVGVNAVWFTQVDGGVMLKADTDANGIEDLQVFIKGIQTLKSTDVIIGEGADTPALVVADASHEGDGAIALSIGADLTDTDGSESLTITVSGVPGGWNLSAGQLVDEETGTYALTPSELEGLTITPPLGTVGSIQLTITATATELSNGDSASTNATLTVGVTQTDVIQGQAIDGYIANATVFADANGDGEWNGAESFTDANSNGVWDTGEVFVDADGNSVWDTAEAKAITDANGNFTLAGGSGPLVMYGGTDVSTGLAFEGVLRAPEGSTVVTPLTTLVAAVLDQNPGMLLETATSNVTAALGLSGLTIDGEPIDILTLDPVAVAVAGGTDGDAAAEVLAAGIQVQNTIVQVGSLLAGAGALDGSDAVVAALAGLVADGTLLDLTDVSSEGDLETLIEDAATAAIGIGSADVLAVMSVAAAVLSAANAEIETALAGTESGAALLEDLAQVAVVAQSEELTAELALAGSQNDSYSGSVATDYTGTGLTSQIESAEVGDIDGGLIGTINDDILTGGAGNDAISGGIGNDSLTSLTGNDTLLGEAGHDTLRAGPGDDVLNGGILVQFIAPEDWLDTDTADYSAAAGPVHVDLSLGSTGIEQDGDGGTDMLSGIEGVVGSNHDDTLIGSDGTFYEFFRGGPGDDTIDGAGFVDRAIYDDASGPINVLLGSGNSDSPSAEGAVTGTSVGADTLFNIELIRGSANGDTFTALGFVSASSPGGLLSTFNEFWGRAGDDTVYGNGNTRASYQNAPGAVTVTLVGPDTVYGGSYGSATGGDGNDTLYGVNAIYGSNHSDTFNGGTTTGSQNYYGRGGNDAINGGPGYDQVRYAFDGPVTTGIAVNLAAGIVVGDPAYTGTDALSGVEAIQGSVLADLYDARGFTANTNPTPSPNAGSLGTFNEIEGMAGDDTVVGNGNTRVSFISAREGVTVDLDLNLPATYQGLPVRLGTATGGASVGTDTIYGGVIAIRGSNFDDSLTGYNNGSGFAQVYQGRGGNDTIAGGGGFDRAEYNEDFTASGISVVRDATYANTLIVAGDPLAIGTDILQDIASVRGTAYADRYDARGYSSGVALGTFNEFEGMAGNDIVIGNGLSGNFATRVSFALATGPVTVQNSGGTSIDPVSGLTLEGVATGGTSVGTDQFTGINYFQGSGFGDTLIGSDSKNETFRPGNGNDSIDGGGGVDILDFRDASAGINIVLQSGSNSGGYWTTGALPGLGGDSYKYIEGVSGSNFNDIIRGSSADDSLSGGSGDDSLYGDAGNSTFTAALGSDTLLGGDGNDTLQPGAIAAGGFQLIDGGAGNDTYDRSNVSSAFNLTINLANGTNPGASGSGIRQLLSIESVVGGNGNDSITGDIYANRLDGFNGNDTINGGAGDDSLYGSAGNDTLTGESGADMLDGGVTVGAPFELDAASYVYAGSSVSVNLLTGLASVTGDAADHDVLSNIELVVGSAYNDTITGAGAPFESFEGRGGNDTIDGGASFDEVSYVFAAGAVIVDLSAVGDNAHDDPSDTVDAGISIDTLYNVESILGTIYADHLTGNSLGNRLRGHAGADTLDGGLGNDEASYQSATVAIVANIGASPYTAGATIVAVGTALDGHGSIDELISIENLRGSAFADILVGSGGGNSLRGDALNDTFIGGGGIDTMDGGSGSDTVSYALAAASVTANLSSGAASDGDGATDTYLSIENAIGSALADTITGGSGNNDIQGGGGDDSLDGADSNDELRGNAGNDTLIGGAGNDILVGDVGNDILTGGTGSDTFEFKSMSDAGDVITDFIAVDRDILKISDLLDADTDYSNGADGKLLADYVQIVNDGSGNGLLQIDTNGRADVANWQTLATLTGTGALDLATLLLDGNLIKD